MRNLVVFSAAVAVILVAGAGFAQQAYTTTSAPPMLVRLKVVAAPGVPATVTLRNGQLGRWSRTDGTQYGLTPVVNNGVARLAIFEITPGTTPGTERIKALATVTLTLDKPVAYPETDPLFEFTFLGTSPIPTVAGSGTNGSAPAARR